MPKPVKKATPARKKSTTPKRPSSDPNRRAKQMLDEQMAKFETSDKPWTTDPGPVAAPSFKEQLSAHMAKLGAKGGKRSGAKRMTNLSDEQRRDIALNAARARWAKKRPKG